MSNPGSLPYIDAIGYYEALLIEAKRHINNLRSYGDPVVFVSHPLSAATPQEEIQNLMRLAAVQQTLWLYGLTPFDQVQFHIHLNPKDPRDFDEKFRIFYRGAVEACDFVIVVPGWERSKGCRDEVRFARECRKRVYMLAGELLQEVEELDIEPVKRGIEFLHLARLSDSSLHRHSIKQTFGKAIRQKRKWWQKPMWRKVLKALPK